jgi:sortase A
MRPTKRKRSNDDALKRAERKSPRRRRRVPILAALLVVLVGTCMIGYPFASDYLNKLEQAKVTQDLAHTIEETPEEDLSAYMQQAIDYNERLLSGSAYVVDPFDPDAPTATDEDYANCLNLNGDGVMGQIVIPKIGVNLPISHGTEGSGMDHGVGHVTNTSLPVGGESTHSVLAGHTGLPSAVIFDKLDQLEVGDYLIIQALGEDHAYRVTSTEVVLPDDTSSLGVKQGEDLVTLVTCTPYGVNSHRLLVHAERCEVPQDWLERKASGDTALPFPYETGSQSFPPFLVGVLVALATILSYSVFKLARGRLTPTGRHGRRRGFR